MLIQAIELASASSGKALASEFLVLRGELLLALSPDNAAEAEFWFQGAVSIAQEVRPPMLELRAAMRLSRLWGQQGKKVQAQRSRGGATAIMAEGSTTVDMRKARALLSELS